MSDETQVTPDPLTATLQAAREEEESREQLTRALMQARLEARAHEIIRAETPVSRLALVGKVKGLGMQRGYVGGRDAKGKLTTRPLNAQEGAVLQLMLERFPEAFDEEETLRGKQMLAQAEPGTVKFVRSMARQMMGALDAPTLGLASRLLPKDIKEAMGTPTSAFGMAAEAIGREAVGAPAAFAEFGGLAKGLGAKAGAGLIKTTAAIAGAGAIMGGGAVATQVVGTQMPIEQQIAEIAKGGVEGAVAATVLTAVMVGIGAGISKVADIRIQNATQVLKTETDRFYSGQGSFPDLMKATKELQRRLRFVYPNAPSVLAPKLDEALKYFDRTWDTTHGRVRWTEVQSRLNTFFAANQAKTEPITVPSVVVERPPVSPEHPVKPTAVAKGGVVEVKPPAPGQVVPWNSPENVARLAGTLPHEHLQALAAMGTLSRGQLRTIVGIEEPTSAGQRRDFLADIQKVIKTEVRPAPPLKTQEEVTSAVTDLLAEDAARRQEPPPGTTPEVPAPPPPPESTPAKVTPPPAPAKPFTPGELKSLRDDYEGQAEVAVVGKETVGEEPTVIAKTRGMDIRNLEAMPRGLGARYLEVVEGAEPGSYIAKKWRRVPIAKGMMIDFGARPAKVKAGVPPEAKTPAAIGRETRVGWTGGSFDARYEVMEARDIIASHDLSGAENQAYPQERQGRMRGQKLSMQLVKERAASFRPEEVGASPNAAYGAPVLSPEGYVDSGNGRILSIETLYEQGRGELYKGWLAGVASQFGIDPAKIQGMERPVLVRRRTVGLDDTTLKAFIQDTNTPTVERLSLTERAIQDADHLTPEMVNKLVPLADGTMSTAMSNPFVKDFLNTVAGPERRDVLTPDGKELTSEGARRMQAAVLVRALGAKKLTPERVNSLLSLIETQGKADDLKNVVSGLMRAAPALAKLQVLIEAGEVKPELDPSPHILDAIDILRKGRDYQGRTKVSLANAVWESTSQNLFPELAASNEGKVFANWIAQNVRSPAAIGEGLTTIARAVADPRYRKAQTPLVGFGDETPGIERLWATFQREVETNRAKPSGAEGVLAYAPGQEGGELPPALKTGEELPPISRKEIADKIQKALGLLVKIGHMPPGTKKTVKGLYYKGRVLARTREAHDLETIAHEVGHALDDLAKTLKTPLVKPLFRYRAELLKLGRQLYRDATPQKARKEGFAELVRRWVVNEADAEAVAPNATAVLRNWLLANPEVGKAMNEFRNGYLRFTAQNPTQVLDSIIWTKKEADEAARGTLWERVKVDWVKAMGLTFDPAYAFLALERRVAAFGQWPTALWESPYEVATLQRSRNAAVVGVDKNSPQQDYNTGTPVGPPLEKILAPIQDQDAYMNLRRYIVAMETINPYTVGGKTVYANVPIDRAMALAALEEIPNRPMFAEVARRLRQWNLNDIQAAEDAGLLPQGSAASWGTNHPYYCPLQRVMEALETTTPGPGGVQPVKRRTSVTKREVIDPIEGSLMTHAAIIKAIEGQRVKTLLLTLVEGTPEQPDPNLTVRPQQVSFEEARTALQKSLLQAGYEEAAAQKILDDISQTDLAEGFNIFRSHAFAPPGSVPYVRDGKLEFLTFRDPTIAWTFENSQGKEPGLIMKAVRIFPGSLNWLLKRMVINWSPIFAPANVVKDFVEGALTDDHWVRVEPGMTLVRAMFGDKVAEAALVDVAANGGLEASLTGSMIRTDPTASIVELTRGSGGVVQRVATSIKSLRPGQTLEEFAHAYLEAIKLSEARGRVASRDTALFWFDKANPDATPLQRAMYGGRYAQEGTTNFTRAGELFRFGNHIFFLTSANAAGTRKFFRNALGFYNVRQFSKDAPPKEWSPEKLAKMALHAAPFLLLALVRYWQNRKDPWYWELPPGERHKYFWFHISTNAAGVPSYLRLPISYDWGVPLQGFPEALLRAVDKRDPKAFEAVVGTLLANLSPSSIPQFLLPPLETTMNKSLYFKTPVFSPYLEDVEAALQDRPSSMQLSRWVGWQLNVSPAKLEHLLRGYTGGLSVEALRVLDAGLQRLKALPPGPHSAVPRLGIGRFIAEPLRYSYSRQQFYDALRESGMAVATTRELVRRGDMQRATAYVQAHVQEISDYAKLTRIARAMNEARQQSYAQVQATADAKGKDLAFWNGERRVVNLARSAFGKDPLPDLDAARMAQVEKDVKAMGGPTTTIGGVLFLATEAGTGKDQRDRQEVGYVMSYGCGMGLNEALAELDAYMVSRKMTPMTRVQRQGRLRKVWDEQSVSVVK